MSRAWSSLAALAAVVAGCTGVPTGLGPGASCVRSSQCQPGLACVASADGTTSTCSSDLTGFGMGMVPMRPMDAGPIDAAMDDAGDPGDGGPPIDMDAGPPTDAPMADAFVPPVDAFVPPVDAFVPPDDAFVPPDDAFVPPDDAFVPTDDAGP